MRIFIWNKKVSVCANTVYEALLSAGRHGFKVDDKPDTIIDTDNHNRVFGCDIEKIYPPLILSSEGVIL